MAKFHQGKFKPRSPEKYQGDVDNIVYRSSWELKAMAWFDSNPSILKWASEESNIKYISPIDQRIHRYFIDFIIQYKSADGTINTAAIEVKPYSQTQKPKYPGKQTRRYLNEAHTFIVNQAKWAAAQEWCTKRGFKFVILTEYELGIKKRPTT